MSQAPWPQYSAASRDRILVSRGYLHFSLLCYRSFSIRNTGSFCFCFFWLSLKYILHVHHLRLLSSHMPQNDHKTRSTLARSPSKQETNKRKKLTRTSSEEGSCNLSISLFLTRNQCTQGLPDNPTLPIFPSQFPIAILNLNFVRE